jgi:hypothetical protein
MRIRSMTQVLVGCLLAAGFPATAAAQAWLPTAREGSVSVTFQGLTSPEHLDLNGKPLERGQVTSGTLVFGVDYGLTHLLAINVTLGITAARHQGADRLHGPLDTGIYHGAVQDARASLAMQLPTGRIAVAPYLGVVLPTHGYETRGHSAHGRRLRVLQMGSWVGADLGPVLPSAYLQGQYAFSLVEKVDGMSINRSNMDFEGGYRIAPFITATVAGSLTLTHGGLDVPLPRDEHYHHFFSFHDRVTKDSRMLMSAGATVSLPNSMTVFGNVVWTTWGRNTHSVKGVVVGTTWTFGPRLPFGGAADATMEPSASSRPAVGFGR